MNADAENAVIDPAAAPSTGNMRAEGDPIEAERVRAEVRFRLFGGTPPTLRIGRFEIGDRLGAGGMGVVYAGRDPDLARPVALKVLFGGGDLRREAQALAKLRHPNVVSVHEIGTWQGLPFVAMELVEGQTLREWLKPKRTVAEISAVFAGAGRGLAAAHAAGLVHRDFKLDNVLVDRDGQARVVDFGLAHPTGAGDQVSHSTRLDAKGTTVTAAGTPAYMAPEVLAGEPATARSDQFSFGVALHEALAGKRPYEARDVGALIAATTKRPPRIPGVPGLLTAMIERCLAPDPEDRYPRLEPIVIGLAPRSSPRVMWIAAGGVAAVVGVAVLVIVTRPPTETAVVDPCAEVGAPVDKVWNDGKRVAIKAAFARASAAFGENMAARASSGLEGYAKRWVTAATEACRSTQPAPLLALRTTCLDDRRRQLAAAIGRFEDADPKTVERSIAIISALPDVESCADTSALAERMPLPQDPAAVHKVGAARDRLAAARVMFQAGNGKDAKDVAAKLAEEVDVIGYAPLTAETQLLLGTITGTLNDLATARVALERAYREGIAGRHDPAAAEAAIKLAHLHGHVDAKPDQGRPWIANAEALLRRIGGAYELEAQLSNSVGNIEQTAGHFELAVAAFDKAERAWRGAPGDHRLDVAQTLHNEGNALKQWGKPKLALPKLREALELLNALVGPDHPYIAMTTNALTNGMRDLGDHAAALPLDQKILASAIARNGPDHPDVGFARAAIAGDYRGLARYQEALAEFDKAGAIFTATFGPDHPTTASTDSNAGASLMGLARYDEAEQRLLKSLAAREKRGATHPSLIAVLDNLGTLELRRGRAAAARKLFERSLAIGEAAMGKDSSDVAITLGAVGEARLALGDASGAKQLLERALALRIDASREELAPTHLALGRTLWQLGDRSGGYSLVTQAAARLTLPMQGYERDQAKRWLASHPAP